MKRDTRWVPAFIQGPLFFSFHPAKNITTLEGGAVSTNDVELARRLRVLRNNGITTKGGNQELSYDVLESSLNAHMNEVSAALGRSQLKRIESFKKIKFDLLQKYAELFEGQEGIEFLKPSENNCYHLATVCIDFNFFKTSREVIRKVLNEDSIATNVHYIPLYLFECFKEFDFQACPEAQRFYERTLTLPLHCQLTETDVERVAHSLLQALKSTK